MVLIVSFVAAESEIYHGKLLSCKNTHYKIQLCKSPIDMMYMGYKTTRYILTPRILVIHNPHHITSTRISSKLKIDSEGNVVAIVDSKRKAKKSQRF